MYRNPNDFSANDDYSRRSGERDYSHPDYYRQSVQSSPSAQPLDSYAEYPEYAYYGDASIRDDVTQLHEYQGPANMEGYTDDVGAEQRETAARGSSEGASSRKKLIGVGGIVATIGALLLKLQSLAFLLKFGGAGITALFSIAVYSIFFGWPFAVGLVGLLFIHEMGHALVMKLKGIPIGALIFVPMLGAAVTMRQMPQNARDEAEVGIAGPVAGAMAASLCLIMAGVPHAWPIWAPLAYFGFFMNLFNLIPIVPFDGGRVLAAIDRRIWIIGFAGLLLLQIWQWLNGNFSLWLLFFIFMAATQLWSRGRTPTTPQTEAYYTVPMGSRITLSLLYFGLAAVLTLGMSISHSLIPLPQ